MGESSIKTIVVEEDGTERVEEIPLMRLDKVKFGNESGSEKKRKVVRKKKN